MNENIMQEVREVIAEYQEKLKQHFLEQTKIQIETATKLADLGLDEDTAMEFFMEATVEATTTSIPASKDDYQLAFNLLEMGLPED